MIDFNPYSQPIGYRGRTQMAFDAVLSYKFSTEDDIEPITLQDAKDWLAVEGGDYDRRIAMLLKAARQKVEKARQISLINRTVTAKVKPGTNLPFGPVKVIASITDDNGATYDNLTDARYYDVTVVYTAGPGTSLSEDLKLEILQELAYLFENRGDATSGGGGISPMIKGNNRVSNRIK